MEERVIWLVGVIAAVIALFGGLVYLSSRIEPDQRDTRNDDWIKKGRRLH